VEPVRRAPLAAVLRRSPVELVDERRRALRGTQLRLDDRGTPGSTGGGGGEENVARRCTRVQPAVLRDDMLRQDVRAHIPGQRLGELLPGEMKGARVRAAD